MSETQQVAEQAPIEQPVEQVQEQQIQAPVEQQAPQEQVQAQQQQTQEEPTGWQIKSLNTDKNIYRDNQSGFDYQEEAQNAEQEVAQESQQVETKAESAPAQNVREQLAEAQKAEQSQPIEFDPFEKLGVKDDPYFQKLYEAYKNDALDDFLIATHTNYDEIPDVDLIRMQVQNQYPTLQPDEQDLILKMKLEKEFNITDLEDSDNRVGVFP